MTSGCERTIAPAGVFYKGKLRAVSTAGGLASAYCGN
jgi:hypothetical protein